MAAGGEGRSMEETATWAVALVCFVMVFVSILIEQIIHHIGSWLKKRHKVALCEALEKIKSELMLMGFISLLLIGLQKPISKICISPALADSWHPCKKKKLNVYQDECSRKGKSPLMSMDAMHELHIFIFILAVFHVLYCITTLVLGRLKMRKWKPWEDETKTVDWQPINEQERLKFSRDTSFAGRHSKFWSQTTILLWIVCFFRQFYKSVTRVDYLTLRSGFIKAHLAPGSERKFEFRKYISRSLEEDFTVIVGISPLMWFFAVLFLLGYTYVVFLDLWLGWYSYYWLPFIPLIIILLVGAKLQMIITSMGMKIEDMGDNPIVHPDDGLFWFSRPRFLLFLIHFVLFQNAFQLAFFAFSWYKYGIKSCFHKNTEDVVIRIVMGIIIHILCSYVTLPLYALVTQMGSTMKPTVFSERVAKAIKAWHRSTRAHIAAAATRGSRHNYTQLTPLPGSPPAPLLAADGHARHPSDDRYWNTHNRGRNDGYGRTASSGRSKEEHEIELNTEDL